MPGHTLVTARDLRAAVGVGSGSRVGSRGVGPPVSGADEETAVPHPADPSSSLRRASERRRALLLVAAAC